MAKLQGSWIWYELMTPDPAASKAFYEAVVPDWTMSTSHGESQDYGFITREDGGMTGGVLHLTEEMRSHGAQPLWLGYIGVDDCDKAVEAALAKGGKCIMPPEDIEMAGRIAMLADCCGAPYYVMTPNSSDGQSTAFSEKDGSCSWNELVAGNQANAIAYYTALYGYTLPDPMDMGPMGSYQFIDHDGVGVGAIMQKPAEMPVAMWSHYFRVPSIEMAKAAVEANGGKIVNGPMEVPGGDWIIQGIDPQGAMFSLVGGK